MSRKLSIGLTALFALALAGCASTPASEAPTADAAEDIVPAEFADAPLIWASAANQPPAAYAIDGAPAGVDPDLAAGLASAIGHEITYTAAPFANNVLGLDAGRVDIVADAAPTAERLEKYDIVAYYNTAYGVAVKAGNEKIDGSDPENLCGYSVSTNAGGYIIPLLEEKSAACTDAGNEPIDIQSFPDGTACALAVQSGRVDAWFGTFPSQQYASSQAEGDWDISIAPWAAYSNSLLVIKGTGLSEALAEGLNAMIADGSYHDIMTEYGLEELELTEAVINPTT